MRIFFTFLAALVSGWIIWNFAEASKLEKFQVFLVGAPITISFFAINFSLSTFQNSEFKNHYSSVSPRLTLGAFLCFLFGIVPVISLAFTPTLSGKIGLTLIPFVFASSLALYLLARSEINPLRLIRRAAGAGKWKRFLKAYMKEYNSLETDPGCKNLVGGKDKATHEFEWKLSPQLDRPNPGNIVSGIGELALSARDRSSFLAAMKTLVESDEIVMKMGHEAIFQYDLRAHYLDPLNDLFLRAEKESSEKLTEAAIDLITRRTLDAVKKQAPNYRAVIGPLVILYRTSLQWMEKGETGPARKALILYRQLWQYGLNQAVKGRDEDVEDDDGIECFFFWHNLNHMARLIEGLGSKAIEINDPGFLHLVHEGLGWQGCSSVKNDALPIGEECIRVLAQLGRESRAAKLECHWDSCAALPHDHAIKRIQAIWSWVSKVKDDSLAERWIDACLAGISRIEGKKIELIDHGRDEEPRWEMKAKDEAYTESFSGPDGSRVLDYSDPNMLKSLVLVGAGGGLMRGATVPIKFKEESM